MGKQKILYTSILRTTKIRVGFFIKNISIIKFYTMLYFILNFIEKLDTNIVNLRY